MVKDGDTYKVVLSDDDIEEDGTVEFKIVKKNADGSTEEVVATKKYENVKAGDTAIQFNPKDPDKQVDIVPVDNKGSTDSTSATSSVSSPDSAGGNGTNGAVQTGNASMAIIILLVLVSATAGIYFARKKSSK